MRLRENAFIAKIGSCENALLLPTDFNQIKLLLGTSRESSIDLRNMSSFDLKTDILQLEIFRECLGRELFRNDLLLHVNLCIISLFGIWP